MKRVPRWLLTAAISLALMAGIGTPASAAPNPADRDAPRSVTSTMSTADRRAEPGSWTSDWAQARADDLRLRPSQDAFPVLLILGLVARLGIKWVIRWYGKTQIKKAAKSYLLRSVDAGKWRHIMAPKHKWSSVGAKSKEQVAELMSRAMSEGKHSARGGTGMQAVWKYKGKTIVVTYAKRSGKISNGWVR